MTIALLVGSVLGFAAGWLTHRSRVIRSAHDVGGILEQWIEHRGGPVLGLQSCLELDAIMDLVLVREPYEELDRIDAKVAAQIRESDARDEESL